MEKTLTQVVQELCQQFTIERKLITARAICQHVQQYQIWSAKVLAEEVPKLINNWRIGQMQMGGYENEDDLAGKLLHSQMLNQQNSVLINCLEKKLQQEKNSKKNILQLIRASMHKWLVEIA